MKELDRVVAHMDLDTFFVAVERLRNSQLMDVPVIIGGLSDRSVVASCSYEARRFGVHSAMPMRRARQLCPAAVVIRGDMEAYTYYSDLVTDVIADKAPVYEKASIDEHYLDISGMDRFFGCAKWMGELKDTIIKETGLPISYGISVNKTVSKMATTESKPNGVLEIKEREVQGFLDPLSVGKIPSVGPKTACLLANMGVLNILTLRQVPLFMLRQMMGKNGEGIWKKAQGIDPAPVRAWSERKSLSKETTFEQDTSDAAYLRTVLHRIVERLCFDLRKQNKLTACVSVKIRYANFDTHNMQRKIPYTAFDHQIQEVVDELFDRLYERRMMIRLIGVRFSHLVGGNQQLNIFTEEQDRTPLYQALDNIRKKYGSKSVRKLSGFGSSSMRQKE